MKVRLEFIGGARWTLLVLALLNPYQVSATKSSELDIVESESRSPYLYLTQREYLVDPQGNYEQVAAYPESNATSSPPGTLKAYANQLKEFQAAIASDESDQNGSPSTAQRFENAYTKYSYGSSDESGQESAQSPVSIQDVLKKHGEYGVPTISSTPGYSTGSPQQESYESYQNPQLYDVPANYYPSDHYEWPQTYSGSPHGPLPGFLSSVGELTASVKHVKSQLGEQKAKTAYQVADIVKNTGYAVNNAILTKGNSAAHVVGQTVYTAGEVLKNKGQTAQKIIQTTGNLATAAVQSAGNVGSSLLRSKGELVGAAIKTGAIVGTKALNAANTALGAGTYLVKTKGDAASNLISKGSRVATSVIGTKGRIISNVINAKGQFAAQIIEAKGRAAATLLETSGQKLSQLADAIKSVTGHKAPPPYGWSEPGPAYGVPSDAKEQIKAYEQPAQLVREEPPLTSHIQNNQYSHSQDYADSYYDPRDRYNSRQRTSNIKKRLTSTAEPAQDTTEEETDDKRSYRSNDDNDEIFQNDYTAYYPHHYQIRPHTDYFTRYQWE